MASATDGRARALAAAAISITLDVPTLCDSVVRGDAASVRASLLLGVYNVGAESGGPRGGVSLPPLPSPPAAEALHSALFEICGEGGEGESELNMTGVERAGQKRRRPGSGLGVVLSGTEALRRRPDVGLRALLMVPSKYETPWKAIETMITSLQTHHGSIGSKHPAATLACVAEANMFLSSVGNHARGAMGGNIAASTPSGVGATMIDGYEGTQRQWMRKLMAHIVAPLFENNERRHSPHSEKGTARNAVEVEEDSKEHLTLPLQLVPSLFAAHGRLIALIPFGTETPEQIDEIESARRMDEEKHMAEMFLGLREYESHNWRREDVSRIALNFDMILRFLLLSRRVLNYMGDEHLVRLRQLVMVSAAKLTGSCAMDGSDGPASDSTADADFPGMLHCLLSFVSDGERNIAAEHHVVAGNVPEYDRAVKKRTSPKTGPPIESTGCSSAHTECNSHVISWEELVMIFYHTAATASSASAMAFDPNSEIKSCLLIMPQNVARSLIFSIEAYQNNPVNIPSWVRVNLLLLTLAAVLKQNRCLGPLHGGVLGIEINSGSSDVSSVAVDALIRLALRDQGSNGLSSSLDFSGADCIDTPSDFMAEMKDVVISVSSLGDREQRRRVYASDGGNMSVLFLDYSKIVRSSILCGQSNSNATKGQRQESAQLWIDAVDALLKIDSNGKHRHRAIVLAAAIFLTTFWEVPSCRSLICQMIRSGLSPGALADRNMQDTDRQHFFSCLVSILSNSIATSSGVEVSDARLALLPLAKLIIVPGRSDSDRGPSEDVISNLSEALSPLPSARMAIYSMAKQLLYNRKGSWLDHAYRTDSTVAGLSDGSDIAVQSLCILLRRDNEGTVQGKDAPIDRYGLQALLAVSDVVASHEACFETRKYLLQRLELLARGEGMSEWTCCRLVQATLFRLLRYFALRNHNAATGIRETIGSHQKLLFIPLQNTSSYQSLHQDDAQQSDNVDEELFYLVSLLIALIEVSSVPAGDNVDAAAEVGLESPLNDLRKKAIFFFSAKSRNASSQSIFSETIITDEERTQGKSACLAHHCLSSILHHLLAGGVARTKRAGASRERANRSNQLWGCSSLMSQLVHNARDSFTKVSNSRNTPLLPQWIRGFAATPPSTVTLTRGDLGITSRRQLDLLSEIGLILILHSKLKQSRLHDRLLASHAANELLRVKRKRSKGFQYKAGNFLCLGESGFTSTIISFFEVSSESFVHLTSGKEIAASEGNDASQKVDMLISAVSDFCECVKESLPQLPSSPETNTTSLRSEHSPAALSSMIRSFWRLYSTMATEVSSQRLIAFIEKTWLANVAGEATEEAAAFSLQSIYSHEQLNVYIQNLRLTILSPFQQLVKSLSMAPTLGVGVARNNHRVGLLQTKSEHVAFWLGVINVLISDLFEGMTGRSCGMTRELYQIVLNSIDNCIGVLSSFQHLDLLHSYQDESDGHTIEDASTACEEGSFCLWNILCQFQLKQAALFKVTLKLSICTLPSLRHRFQLVEMRKQTEPSTFKDETPDFVSALSTQCYEYLQHRESAKVAKNHPPAEQGDAEKSEAQMVDDSSANASQGQLKSPSHGNPKENESRNRGPKGVDKIILSSTHCWSWAYSSCFFVAERVWADSDKLIKARRALEETYASSIHCSRNPLLPANAVWYISRRCRDLHSAACSALLLFQRDKAEGRIPTAPRTPCGAVLLTQQLKTRLCSLLERVSLTLKHSIQLLAGISKTSNPASIGWKGFLDSTSFHEAIACLFSWVFSPHLDQTIGLVDITAGARYWYDSEKKAAAATSDQFLSRLTKAMSKMEELPAMVQNLYINLLSRRKKASGDELSSFNFLDTAVRSAFTVTTGNNDNIFLRSLKSFLEKLSASCAKIPSIDLLSLEEIGPPSAAETNKIRTIRTKRKIRKQIVRSKNKTVDEWLGHDCQIADGGANDDSYDDLENFIVEG